MKRIETVVTAQRFVRITCGEPRIQSGVEVEKPFGAPTFPSLGAILTTRSSCSFESEFGGMAPKIELEHVVRN
jgi:hypothetical protein